MPDDRTRRAEMNVDKTKLIAVSYDELKALREKWDHDRALLVLLKVQELVNALVTIFTGEIIRQEGTSIRSPQIQRVRWMRSAERFPTSSLRSRREYALDNQG